MAEPLYQWTVRLPVPLGEWVEAEAKRRDVPRSQVIVESLEAERKRAEGARGS